MKQKKSSYLGLYSIGIALIFLAGFFMLVIFGAQCYRSTVMERDANIKTRSVLSYLSAVVREGDSSGAVSVERDSVLGDVLTVRDGDSGYAFKVYSRGGKLLEEYVPAESEPDADSAETIGETESFAVTEMRGGLLMIDTDEGRVLIRLRSLAEDQYE